MVFGEHIEIKDYLLSREIPLKEDFVDVIISTNKTVYDPLAELLGCEAWIVNKRVELTLRNPQNNIETETMDDGSQVIKVDRILYTLHEVYHMQFHIKRFESEDPDMDCDVLSVIPKSSSYYGENHSGTFYYGGCNFVEEIETLMGFLEYKPGEKDAHESSIGPDS